MKAVILAGGSGERFWPLSTKDTPKQFLKLFADKTLIRQTFERLSYRLSPEDVYVVTNQMYAHKTYEELPEVPKENILLELLKKNTAPACTWATLQFDDEETIFIVPADHFIPDVEKFWNAVELAEKFLQDKEGIITFGIVPTRPETGYGYIEVESEISDNVYSVKMFREKPNYETAVEYLNSGRFFWNSGMFMWKKKYFLKQMRKHSKDVLEPFFEYKSIEETYEKVPSISIDYALMEKADKIYTIKADFVWSDVGNWKSLEELGVENSPHSVLIDSKAFVQTTKPTIVIGLEDVIVVETENGILVAKSTELEKIRAALGKLDGAR
ncbi:mannose-1-phosphate guanylyltransferase [Fervidobacterium changbaicum]|uniref:Mannose-1-phosphate guanylyltransferase n=1 Tax=Fervidobacterium changbaicum TaxID=310769 RepID=A0ABX5QTB6_9BACT|nr:mannose-1-phosphate guanylyltransferase [Fervidobacterium changbaicum]QAV33771.1 mannose-1-phosphate guanylyltransferase [Fervidobacterium changbaicum]SDH32832.1 mannose-1-phosphate guanylyltransferase [Fervidobacterium changbaicum]